MVFWMIEGEVAVCLALPGLSLRQAVFVKECGGHRCRTTSGVSTSDRRMAHREVPLNHMTLSHGTQVI